jgi:TolB protein
MLFKEHPMTPREECFVESTLEILDIATGERCIVHRARDHFEAPNWILEGKTLLFNSKGKLYTISIRGGKPRLFNTGFADQCNNDHGFSPDGKWLAISHSVQDRSHIFILPASGGTPQRVTEFGPSYWHGWSPDGKKLAYCAERNGEFDIYVVPAGGGEEKRLTKAPGLDDGPAYSPDGLWIYFNSERTGLMKIWRMKTDGSNQEQVTFDDSDADWFPHPSPDGKWIVFLSYDRDVHGHPANRDVKLRIMPAPGGKPRILAELFGGQGTINVPSWSPDSRFVAFVSYRLI